MRNTDKVAQTDLLCTQLSTMCIELGDAAEQHKPLKMSHISTSFGRQDVSKEHVCVAYRANMLQRGLIRRKRFVLPTIFSIVKKFLFTTFTT